VDDELGKMWQQRHNTALT